MYGTDNMYSTEDSTQDNSKDYTENYYSHSHTEDGVERKPNHVKQDLQILSNRLHTKGMKKASFQMSTDTSSDRETPHHDNHSSQDTDENETVQDEPLVDRKNSILTEYSSVMGEPQPNNRLEQRRLSLLAELPETIQLNAKKHWSLSIRHDIMDNLRKEMESGAPAVFPCLNDGLLENLELEKDGPGIYELSTQEIERKFALLSIALKSDRESLGERSKEKGRVRERHERKVDDIANQIKANLSCLLVPGCSGSIIQIIRNIHKHLQVLQQSVLRLAATSETAGAVVQENKVAYAVEVYMSHVEKLRNVQEKEKKELEEFRKIIHKIESCDESSSVQDKRRNLSSIEISTSGSQCDVEPDLSIGPSSPSSPSSSTDNNFNNSQGESDSEERGGEDGVCEEVGALQEDTGAVTDQDLEDDVFSIGSERINAFLTGNVQFAWLAEMHWEEVDLRRVVDWLISGFIVSTLLYLVVQAVQT